MAAMRRAMIHCQRAAGFLRNPSRTHNPALLGAFEITHRNPIARFATETEVDRSSPTNPLLDENKRRLLNRSKQRGFLELDLVLGKWVEENIRSLDENHLKALVEILDVENPYLWKWLTAQEPAPEAVMKNPVFSALHQKILKNLNTYASPETRAKPGQPWVRGWDDKRGLGGPAVGNQ